MKQFLSRVNWKHTLALTVTLAAAAVGEMYNIKHTALVAVATGLLTRLDLILSPRA